MTVSTVSGFGRYSASELPLFVGVLGVVGVATAFGDAASVRARFGGELSRSSSVCKRERNNT